LELNAENLISKTPVIDLHIDSFIWTRIFGYDWQKPHSDLLTKGYFAGQVDLPRLKNGGFSGAIWSITTNPLRTSLGRARTFEKNLNQFKKWIAENPTQLKLISTAGDFDSIQSKDQHAMWISVQGGNAIDHDLNLIEKFAPEVTSVTLMHLMHSKIGTSMTPYPTFRKRGLTQFGRDFVGKLNKHRIFVDLAHADRETFMDVIKVHDSSQPLIVSHTGVKGIYDCFRNIDDEQLKCVAKTGGVVGIIFEPNFLGKGKKGEPLDQILNHLEYIQKTIGDDFAALGSDWDGMIVPPKRLRSAEQFPALVTLMMKRGWTRNQIEKVLGLNYLRAFRLLRP
jgi:membrane dipeptidase